MTSEPGNGFELHGGRWGLSGNGPLGVAGLLVVGLLAAIGVMVYLLYSVNAAGFERTERQHGDLNDSIRCFTYVLAPKDLRDRMVRPRCIREEGAYGG